jgi:hypothetical protein
LFPIFHELVARSKALSLGHLMGIKIYLLIPNGKNTKEFLDILKPPQYLVIT